MEHGHHHSGMWVPGEPPTWGRTFLPHLGPESVLAVLSVVAAYAERAVPTSSHGEPPRSPLAARAFAASRLTHSQSSVESDVELGPAHEDGRAVAACPADAPPLSGGFQFVG